MAIAVNEVGIAAQCCLQWHVKLPSLMRETNELRTMGLVVIMIGDGRGGGRPFPSDIISLVLPVCVRHTCTVY